MEMGNIGFETRRDVCHLLRVHVLALGLCKLLRCELTYLGSIKCYSIPR
jgi:hypothetical protein